MRASPLARVACAVYALLIVYGSLYPFTGWRNQGLSPFDFVVAPTPRFVTAFDVAANLIGYVPYGFLCVLALHPRLQGMRALGVGALSGTLLSLCMEALQTYLPTRFASNLDVLCNLGGTIAGGALALRFVPWLLGTGPLHRARSALFQPGLAADLGLVLLGVWLLPGALGLLPVKLTPQTLWLATWPLLGGAGLAMKTVEQLLGVPVPDAARVAEFVRNTYPVPEVRRKDRPLWRLDFEQVQTLLWLDESIDSFRALASTWSKPAAFTKTYELGAYERNEELYLDIVKLTTWDEKLGVTIPPAPGEEKK